ncbi:hypothetical protein [Streptomyces sp. B1I3]|uniref:hypothetical protein n=1 Tax=Streptomyces sp. B1I3 TaxID=3042264 RepID=UPI002786B135|nr:hypothetical protein [Streptomyces sp. B1I3]MDQ0791723.1 hypothetical protein [Streptomyces sp. B1I3]
MTRAPRRPARSALLLAALLASAACTGPATDRPADDKAALTEQQAELLALTRFTNYRSAAGTVTATIPVQGRTLRLDGRLDWRVHTGYAELRDETPGAATRWRHLLRWNRGTVSARFNWTGPRPDEPPADGWSERRLEPRSATVDSTLLLLLSLGSDRPENAQLLVRSSARFLGHEKISGVPVTVFSGPGTADAPGSTAQSAPGTPGRTRYWIDADGGLRRFAARLGGSGTWMTADISRQPPSPPTPSASAAP